jgi:hypothetical protein
MHLSRRSKLSVVFSLLCFVVVIGGVLLTGALQGHSSARAASAASNQVVRQVTSGGTTSIFQAATGKDGVSAPEVDQTSAGLSKDIVNRNLSRASHAGANVTSAAVNSSNSNLVTSFNGENFRQQRLANNGNQFSVEPPDQGLCVGNGFVMESVNDVLSVYDAHGNSLKGPIDLNTFYGYIPAIVRPSTFGPEVTDPSCYFDKATQRWFQIALTLDRVGTTSALAGTNHIDIAVSHTADPRGLFTIYRIPAQDDGTQGTPNHMCQGAVTTGPCLGDYPHLGADANGFYVTTNEYGLFAPGLGFHAAQIYALPKLQLAANAATISFVQIDTIGLVGSPGAGFPGNPGFTVWPSTSPDGKFSTSLNGTEYFMSSDAAPEANGNGASRDLVVWTLSNTASLNGASPALLLGNAVLTVNPYSIPPRAIQKNGNTPLITCLNTPSTCAPLIIGGADPFTEAEGPLDSNDTRIQQVTYVNGKLYGALDTSVTVHNVNEAGIEWFVVNPVTPKVVNQGYLGGNNANLIYPAIGVTASGKGVMAFTLVGPNNFPSAAYTTFDAQNGPGAIQFAAKGLGPQDGFTETKIESPFGNGVPRPRWGDYGAAVPVNGGVWIASEYIGQTCTFQQYITNTVASPLFSCNMTRTALGNWYTRISLVSV